MFSITFLRIFKVMGNLTWGEDACFSEVISFSMVNVVVGSTWSCNLCVNAIADKCVRIVDACNPNVWRCIIYRPMCCGLLGSGDSCKVSCMNF